MTSNSLPLSHTPGPWTFNEPLNWVTSETIIICEDVAPYGPNGDVAMTPEHSANGRLIAAAPDLLAAIELALSHIGWCWDVIEQNTNMTRGGSAIVHDQIRAAIAKATGEQRQ